MKRFPILLAAMVGFAGAAMAQAPAPAARPNEGAFNLPIMCDTEANYRRLIQLASLDAPDDAATRDWQGLMQQSCVIPAFATNFIVVEEKGDMARIELRRLQDGQIQTGASYWLAKRHVERFRCPVITLNGRSVC